MAASNWQVRDELWEVAEPLLPVHERDPRGGRPRVDDRVCFGAIAFVLFTRIAWAPPGELERRPRQPEPVGPCPDARLEEAASPIYDPAARYVLREGMELALLTAIQKPLGRQRAVRILRDVLGWTGPEVAELLDSTVAAVNSALQRARATIDQELPAAPATPAVETERDLLRRYVDAWERVDVDGLVALLRDDATMRMPPLPALLGAAAIGGFFRDTAATSARSA